MACGSPSHNRAMQRDGKYAPLREHLTRQSSTVTMRFADIEGLLGHFPKSARTYSAWWSNTPQGSRHNLAWLNAGYRVAAFSLPGETVTFEPADSAPARPPKPRAPRAPGLPVQRHEPVAVGDGQLTVAFTWKTAGVLQLDKTGRMVFPIVPAGPGLYRFRWTERDGDHLYIGESSNLATRFTRYRNPGPKQSTNIRMNERLLPILQLGGLVDVDTVTAVTLGDKVADLGWKPHRLVAENTALAQARATGVVEIFNL